MLGSTRTRILGIVETGSDLVTFATEFEEVTVMYVLYITMKDRHQPVTVMKVSVTSIAVFERAESIRLYIFTHDFIW